MNSSLLRFRSNASTQHKISFSCQLQQQFLMQQKHTQYSLSQQQEIQYTNLLNQVMFINDNKKNKIRSLNKNIRDRTTSQKKILDKSLSRIKSVKEQKIDFNDVKKRIIQQQQIKNHLLKDINQITKSMNLLKSDIGRIIHKTQSTTILQKKTNKTKVIVNDQLQKLSLAFQKDYAQIQQTYNLQIKFNNKLKNICNNQQMGLVKMKKNLYKIKEREKYINQRIKERDHIMKNLNERQKYKEMIKIIGQQNRQKLGDLLSMVSFVNDVQKEQNKTVQKEKDNRLSQSYLLKSNNSIKSNSLISELNIDTLLSFRMPSFKLKIKQIQTYLVNFISLLNTQLNRQNFLYQQLMDKYVQYYQKLKQLNGQYENKYHEIYDNLKDNIDMTEYNVKYRQFQQKVKVIMQLWCFMQNNKCNYDNKCDQIVQKPVVQNQYTKRQSVQLQTLQLIHTNSIQKQDNYMKELYNLTMYLGNFIKDYQLQQQFLLKKVEIYITKWFQSIRQKIQAKPLRKFKLTYTKESFISKKQIPKQNSNRASKNLLKYRHSSSNSSDLGADKFKLILDLFNRKSNFGSSNDQLINQKNQKMHDKMKTQGNQVLKNSSPHQRIKYLNKIQKQHYLLMKNVFKCQKQNNQKDYIFKRQFNRTKWQQKNLLQQQKIYQANFTFQNKNKQRKNMIHSSYNCKHKKLKSSTIEQQVKRRSDKMDRYSIVQEEEDEFKYQSYNKLSRKSIMVQKNNMPYQRNVCRLNTKISFADGDPEEFY